MLVDRTVSAVNIDQYALLVVDKLVRRELIKIGNDLVQLGYETSTELDAILNKAEEKIFVLNKYKEERQKALHNSSMLSIARPPGTNIFQLVIGTVLCFK